jgi:dGTPase
MLRTRDDLCEREARDLAPYGMRARDTRGRARPEEEHPRRTPFQRDRDRIVHSTAFRRLQYKTQVFVNDEGDHFRTRLTHTIEVAQIARSIARTIGLNEDLVEAAALGHDLGHAPFGHSGGDALDACMRERGGFEHNRQTLRIVDVLERGFAGLNLTWEVREALAKHERLDPSVSPLLEAQLVDTADAIAYDAHDLDDGLRAGLLREEDLAPLALWRRAGSFRRLIDLLVTDLVDESMRRLERERIDSVAAVRAREGYLIGFSPEVAAGKRELQRFLFERLYRHPDVVAVRERTSAVLADLFRAYVGAPGRLPPEWRAFSERAGLERAVCDYVAGMTDRYARQERERLLDGGAAPGSAPSP